MKKEIPVPVIAVILVVVLALCSVFLYNAATGGKQGDGKVNNVEATPPGQKEMMQRTHMQGQAPHR